MSDKVLETSKKPLRTDKLKLRPASELQAKSTGVNLIIFLIFINYLIDVSGFIKTITLRALQTIYIL